MEAVRCSRVRSHGVGSPARGQLLQYYHTMPQERVARFAGNACGISPGSMYCGGKDEVALRSRQVWAQEVRRYALVSFASSSTQYKGRHKQAGIEGLFMGR